MTKLETLRGELNKHLGKTDLENINTLLEKAITGSSLDHNLVRTLISTLPELKKPKISILQISTKSTTIIQKLIHKYQDQCHFLDITLLFDNQEEMEICKMIGDRYFPVSGMLAVHYKTAKFLDLQITRKFDLVIGIPENQKIYSQEKKQLCAEYNDPNANNLISFITQKCLSTANHLALIYPKYFLHNAEYHSTRQRLAEIEINTIVDYGEHGFCESYSETVCLVANCRAKPNSTRVISLAMKQRTSQSQADITNPMFPTWIVYTNDFFKHMVGKLEFDQLKVYRDRSISARLTHDKGEIRVLNAKNIPRNTKSVIHTANDVFVNAIDMVKTESYLYMNHPNAYICPNLTAHPRMLEKPLNTIASGSLAVFTCKDGGSLTQEQLDFFGSEEFENFYRLVRNYCTRSLNIDKNAAFYFGKLKTEKPQSS